MVLDRDTVIGVVGAGAMGSGIAQVAAAAGHRVILGDVARGATQKAQATIGKAMEREVQKARMSRDAADEVMSRIDYQWEPLGDDLANYNACGFTIEAITEDLAAKQALFRRLEASIAPDAVLATNTSSLSVASIASACNAPQRVVGVHFFNPAPVLPLVEVIPWMGGEPSLTPAIHALMQRWSKTPVIASDTPGFIVNRIARPFYGEAIRLLEEGIADVATIDIAMKELGGFRMGPFELMDFIGNDVNYAVTKSVFEGFFYDPRYRPSLTQRRLVESGFLGKKSGRGYYDYRDAVETPVASRDPKLATNIFERILAMLINEAWMRCTCALRRPTTSISP
jgi:3-hydroxybutyryl-CoA dehydrogenase